jgi:hypothetical protein
MAAIYSDAYLVVGASHVRDSSQGFVESKGPINRSMRVATVENDNGTTSEIHTRVYSPHGDLCNPFCRLDNKSPLASRAWTLQEQILSTRMVHFEHNELFWECREWNDCECMEVDSLYPYKARMEREAAVQLFTIWHAIIEKYTRDH